MAYTRNPPVLPDIDNGKGLSSRRNRERRYIVIKRESLLNTGRNAGGKRDVDKAHVAVKFTNP